MGLGDTHVGLLLSCFLISCAHPPPAPVSAPAPVAAPAPPDPFAVTAEWKPEAAEAPGGIWLRVKSPAQILPRVLKLAADPSLMGFSDLRVMAGLLLGGELTALIDFDAPIDLALARDQDADDGAILAAAHLTDEAHFAPRALGNKLHPLAPGRWEIRPEERNERVQCELWHAPAPVGYRIVCGAQGDAIAQYAPFLLGRLAKEALTSDAHFGSTHYPFSERFGAKIQDEPGSPEDEATDRLGKSLMNAESIALDLDLGDPDIELSLRLSYLETGTSNLRPGRLGGAPQPIPPQFWQAYSFAPFTLLSTGVDDQARTEFESLWGGSLKAFFDDISRSSGMTPELSERVTRAAGDIPDHFRFTLSRPVLVPGKSSEPSKRGRSAKDTEPSWCLCGFAGSGERYKAGLDVLFEASKAKSSASPTSRWVRLDKRPPNLPPESILYRTDAPDKKVSFTLVLPTPEWVWILVAPSQNELFGQARRLIPTLSKPPEPDPVAQAAFASDALLAMTVNLVALKNTLGDRLSNINFANLPARGTAPIFLRVTGQRQQRADHPTLSITLHSHWTPAAFADLLGLIKINQALTADEHPP